MALHTQTNSANTTEDTVHTANSLDRPNIRYPDTSKSDNAEHATHYGWHFFLGEKCTPIPRRRTARYYIEENGSTSVGVSMEYPRIDDNRAMSEAEYCWIMGGTGELNLSSISPDEDPNINEPDYNMPAVSQTATETEDTSSRSMAGGNQDIGSVIETGPVPQIEEKVKEGGEFIEEKNTLEVRKRKAEVEEVVNVPSKRSRNESNRRVEEGAEAPVASGSNVTLDGAKVDLSNYSCKVEGCNYVATSTKEGSAKLCLSRHMLGHESDPVVYVCLGPTGCKKCYIRADSCKRHIDGEVRNGVRVPTCPGTRVAMRASEYRHRFPDFSNRLTTCLKGKIRR